MMRTSRSTFGVLATLPAALAIAAGAVLAQTAPTPAPLHPPSGGPDRPIVIAVLGDNFGPSELGDFREAAENFFVHGVLDDDFFRKHDKAFTIKTVFRPNANYGFRVGRTLRSNCNVSWDNNTDTAAALERDASAARATHVVVIGNYHYNFGCKYDNWIYVAKGAVGQDVLHHEFGHLVGGLFDEYSVSANAGQVHPDAPITRANCTSVQPAPHWSGVPQPYQPGCALYPSTLFHAYPTCRMGAHGREFCDVCRAELQRELECLMTRQGAKAQCNLLDPRKIDKPEVRLVRTPLYANVLRTEMAQPVSQDQAVVDTLRMLVRVQRNLENNKPIPNPIRIISASNSTAPNIPRIRRLGDYVYEVADETARTVAIGVIPSDPFEIREYAGGPNEHRRTPSGFATFLIPIPTLKREHLLEGSRAISITIYKLKPQVDNTPISAERLNFLKKEQVEVVAQLPAGAVRQQLKELPMP
jgi:hypothetical protein